MDEAGRILALEAQLADTQRSLTAHDFLLRALLTHLALSDADAFQGLVGGFARSGFYGERAAGGLTGEVGHELTDILEEVAARVAARR
ncbi:hypothetical protein [Phenylobacterium sp.]|uniref:hypothetical protein n=1 Tax=Phenylobacterium sp. TaxID=1871053 RepID=UPI002B9A7C37|nr:hypothetical protein [Phenylobacterium sp.]HVI33800.1 hypothetical protein [Phenylobacterium sp.]